MSQSYGCGPSLVIAIDRWLSFLVTSWSKLDYLRVGLDLTKRQAQQRISAGQNCRWTLR
jgi:hypothetical protein